MRLWGGRSAIGQVDMGWTFLICAYGVGAAPLARWIWAGGFLSLENGRGRADHGGGAKRENGHFQGVGKYGKDQPHDLIPASFYPALWLLYRHIGTSVGKLVAFLDPNVLRSAKPSSKLSDSHGRVRFRLPRRVSGIA